MLKPTVKLGSNASNVTPSYDVILRMQYKVHYDIVNVIKMIKIRGIDEIVEFMYFGDPYVCTDVRNRPTSFR